MDNEPPVRRAPRSIAPTACNSSTKAREPGSRGRRKRSSAYRSRRRRSRPGARASPARGDHASMWSVPQLCAAISASSARDDLGAMRASDVAAHGPDRVDHVEAGPLVPCVPRSWTCAGVNVCCASIARSPIKSAGSPCAATPNGSSLSTNVALHAVAALEQHAQQVAAARDSRVTAIVAPSSWRAARLTQTTDQTSSRAPMHSVGNSASTSAYLAAMRRR
jgi:hypothetical protein